MKRILVVLVALSLLMVSPYSVACAESNVWNVTSIEWTLHLKDVDRLGKYTGEVENGVPNGHGCFETKNALGDPWYYIGEFKDGAMSGEGTQFWIIGKADIGTFKDNVLVEGKIIYSSGYTVEGTFSDGDAGKGTGKLSDPSGWVYYEGEFDNLAPHGKGVLYDEKGNVIFSGRIDDFSALRKYVSDVFY